MAGDETPQVWDRALCGPGGKVAAALTLALHGEQASEIREHPYLKPGEVIVMRDPEEIRPPFEMPKPPPVLPYTGFSLSPPSFPYGRQPFPSLGFPDSRTISGLIRDEILRAFDLKPWHIGLRPPSRRLKAIHRDYHRRRKARARRRQRR